MYCTDYSIYALHNAYFLYINLCDAQFLKKMQKSEFSQVNGVGIPFSVRFGIMAKS